MWGREVCFLLFLITAGRKKRRDNGKITYGNNSLFIYDRTFFYIPFWTWTHFQNRSYYANGIYYHLKFSNIFSFQFGFLDNNIQDKSVFGFFFFVDFWVTLLMRVGSGERDLHYYNLTGVPSFVQNRFPIESFLSLFALYFVLNVLYFTEFPLFYL